MYWFEGPGRFKKLRKTCRNHPTLISCQVDFTGCYVMTQKHFWIFLCLILEWLSWICFSGWGIWHFWPQAWILGKENPAHWWSSNTWNRTSSLHINDHFFIFSKQLRLYKLELDIRCAGRLNFEKLREAYTWVDEYSIQRLVQGNLEGDFRGCLRLFRAIFEGCLGGVLEGF